MADTPNPNEAAVEQAAAAVDPQSPFNQNFIARARSPGEAMFGKQAASDKDDNDFMSGLAKAHADLERQKGGATAEGEGDEGEEPAAGTPPGQPAAQPAARKLTDPPVAPRQRSNFRKLEAQRDQLAARVAELESGKGGASAQAQAGSAQPAAGAAASATSLSPEQVSSMLKEINELRSEIALYDITKSPDFSAKFERPRELAIQRAKNMAGPKGAEVEAALAMPMGALRDAQLEELLKGLPQSTATIVEAANKYLASLEYSKSVEIDTMRVTAGDRQKQREIQAAREATARAAEFDAVATAWRAVPALDPSKSTTASTLLERARSFYDGNKLSHAERAAVALSAVMLDPVMAENAELLAENERLQKTLARYTNGSPGGGGGAAPEAEDPGRPLTPDEERQRFQQGLKRAMNSDPTFAALRRSNRTW